MWTYAYNLDNQLTAANKTGSANSLAYDGAGRLRQTTLASVITNLAYDGSDLVAEYNSAGSLLRRYVHGPGVDEPLVWYEGAVTTAKTWLYSDHQGSIVATANSAGTSTATLSYGPYGEPNATTGVRFRYTGQQLLGPLNLYYYKARMYSPAIGRFLQTDPIGYQDGLNLYAYVGNNPFNRRDPSGLIAADARMLAGKIGGSIDNWASSSYAAARNESLSSFVFDKALPAFGPETAIVGVGIGSIGKTANVIGKEGELAVKAMYDIGEKAAFSINGRSRIADGFNRVTNVISEVKNVAYQHYSTQIKDYVSYAQQEGLQFNLYVRENTNLSPQLKSAIESGLINLGIIPKP